MFLGPLHNRDRLRQALQHLPIIITVLVTVNISIHNIILVIVIMIIPAVVIHSNDETHTY